MDAAWLGELADSHPAVASSIQAAGHAHGKGMKSYLLMMGIRLIEMRRVLKPDGSVWLHCDDTAGSYLRMLMDAIFGTGWYRNEVTWKRSHGAKNLAGRFHREADNLLYYAGKGATWNPPYQPLSDDYVEKWYKGVDADGRRWMAGDLLAPGSGGYQYEFLGETKRWRMPEMRAKQLLDQGRIVHESTTPGSRRKVARIKRYLDESKGALIGSIWTDIKLVKGNSKERVGYPTQKPLALLERVIKASSNEGDVVLDPFCGCATTCVAAESLGRRWIGIDLSEKAAELVAQRLHNTEGLFNRSIRRDDIPLRTDIDKPPHYRTLAHVVYGEAEGCCHYCGVHFEFRNTSLDHKVPKSKGGTDHKKNIVLSCFGCNIAKGDMGYYEFKAKRAKLVAAAT